MTSTPQSINPSINTSAAVLAIAKSPHRWTIRIRMRGNDTLFPLLD
jgi:hypothetical protein